MPVIRVDNQQSAIPRPLLVVRLRKPSSGRGSKSRTIKPRDYRTVRAITPDLLWSYVSERVVDKNGKLGGLKYAILSSDHWPKWLRLRVKSEDQAARLTGIELEPAWSESLAQQITDMERRAKRRWRHNEVLSRPPKRVRNPADDILVF